MKKLSKKLLFSIAGLSLVGLIYGHSIKDYKYVNDVTYQGYNVEKTSGNIYGVFDSETLKQRIKDGRTAEYSLETNGVPSLKIGEKYNLVYGIPNFKWLYGNRLLDIKKGKN